MPYYTTTQNPIYQQVSLDEILDGYVDPERFSHPTRITSGTRTIFVRQMNEDVIRKFNVPGMIRILREFVNRYSFLYEVDRNMLYDHFEIPKNSIDPNTGRHLIRPIDAPKEDLKRALYELKSILETKCGASYHTNSFAYIPRRCAVDAIRKHQSNQSKWFLKTDFSNFFGNTTEQFVFSQLRMIFPFSEMYFIPGGKEVLEKAMSLCFLNGGLPQGTPISPMLTNVVMIPIDHRLTNTLRSYRGNHYIYTRYADDILISSKVKFDYESIIVYLNQTLREFSAPFHIKDEKTRFGSRNGHNFNLGVILNDKNEITIGYKTKMAFRGCLNDYIQTRRRGETYPLHDLQIMDGRLSYYSSIEPQYWERTIARFNEKYSFDLKEQIRRDLRNP